MILETCCLRKTIEKGLADGKKQVGVGVCHQTSFGVPHGRTSMRERKRALKKANKKKQEKNMFICSMKIFTRCPPKRCTSIRSGAGPSAKAAAQQRQVVDTWGRQARPSPQKPPHIPQESLSATNLNRFNARHLHEIGKQPAPEKTRESRERSKRQRQERVHCFLPFP